ncbi:MAG: alpha/beta fold hydrolase, partial [Cyanobacteria bacterium P01_H01_bin.130]
RGRAGGVGSNLVPWAIAGYSMGGRLALDLAVHFPEVFPVSVAIAASPGLENAGDRQKRQALDSQRALTLDACKTPKQFEQFLARWYQMPLFSNLATHPSFDAMVTRRRRNNPQWLAQSLRYLGLGQQPFLTPALAEYPGQLHLVVGEHDRKFIDLNQAIARQCPRAQLTMIPHSGHTIPLENPAALAQLLSDVLDAAAT